MSKKSLIGQLSSKFAYLLGGALALTSMYFWTFKYPAHLAFKEQFQLFLLNSDYFISFINYPSGIAQYIGEFLTQFSYEVWCGAAIISLLTLGIYILSYIILSRETKEHKLICALIALIPAVFVWGFMLDRFSLLAMPVALVITLISIFLYPIWANLNSNNIIKCILTAGLIAILYWAFGALTFLFGLYVMLYEVFRHKAYCHIVHIGVIAILPIIAYIFVPFPLQRLYTSNCYYKILDDYPSFKYDAEEEDALLYSYFSHYKKWDAAIKHANKKMPNELASRQIVLHALAEKNQLLDKLFDYPILFKKELISAQVGDMTEPTSVSDLYFSLGMINIAELSVYNMQQLYFSQSARAFQRLIECNIIKKDYRNAKKYIHTLKQTFFYKEWSEKMENMLKNESNVEKHLYYGSIKNRLMNDTFYFSDKELDIILAHSVKSNYDTNINYDYLVAYLILANDLDKLAKLMEGNTNRLPKSIQEALVYYWMSKYPSFDNLPWNIDKQVLLNAVEFMRQLSNGGNMRSMRPAFGKTYWYYNTFTSHILQ